MVTDSFDFAEWLLEQMLPKHFKKVACVGTPTDFEQNKDFSLFARNRGLNFCVFESFSEAIEWLESDLTK